MTLVDPQMGDVRLTGLLARRPGDDLLIVLHGLGGVVENYYLVAAARAADQAQLSCLRLHMRGADGGGDDFYHAGLTDDLHAALGSPALSRYRHVYVLGYSLGGHVSLRYATEPGDPRVRGVAAVCPPLDLSACVEAIDRPAGAVYRHHMLRSLKQAYAKVAAKRPVPTPPSRVNSVGSIRRWDDLTVAPRWGFRDAQHYYAEASVGPRLSLLRVPSLLVFAEQDPLVPTWTVRPSLQSLLPPSEVRFVPRAGHLGFPSSLDLGQDGPLGLEPQILSWLARPSELSWNTSSPPASKPT
jgi:predicted alpha/beta-fold hydrolase